MVRSLTAACVLVAALAATSPSHAGQPARHSIRFGNGSPAQTLRARWIVAPLNWLVSTARLRWFASAPPEGSVPIREDEGWVELAFPVSEEASGLFLEVAGRVEFEHARIVGLAGGERTLELRGARRGRGMYELVSLEPGSRVDRVELRARAASALAHVAVRIGR